MFSVAVSAVVALVASGMAVSRMVPPVPGCSRPVAFAVSGLAMTGVAVFTLFVTLAALQTQLFVAGDPFAAQVWVTCLIAALVSGGLLVGAASGVAVLARRR